MKNNNYKLFGKTHKNRIKSAQLHPAFMIRILLEVSAFLTYYLGLNIKALSLKKD